MTHEANMNSIPNDMEEFQGQLRKGAIRRAYRALISYMMPLSSMTLRDSCPNSRAREEANRLVE
jgi:hypothetical protein